MISVGFTLLFLAQVCIVLKQEKRAFYLALCALIFSFLIVFHYAKTALKIAL